MIRRELKIGRWMVEFYFATDGYDQELLLDRLYDNGASGRVMHRTMDLMEGNPANTGFTFSNPVEHYALVAVGPTSGGDEFLDTFVHEVHHLAVAIASGLGIDLDGEGPAYLSGDTARALAETVCELGCSLCH